MALTELSSPADSTEFRLPPAVELICFALCVGNLVYLAASFVHGDWMIDATGHGSAVDFVNFWAAGREVLDGNPAIAYDVELHKAAEIRAVGHPFEGYYPWFYPPTFLFVAALIALLPYVPAFAAWIFLTFAAYVAAVRHIIGHRIGIVLACAFPGVLSDFVVGQNGFLTAALLGGTLGLMERRPLLAGCLLGLLTYKPQFGILFPLVLAVGGRWRVILAAAVTAALAAAASWIAFGGATWEAFFHAMPIASRAHLTEGVADWAKLQSVFTLVRWLGGSEGLAWALHIPLIGAGAIVLCALWRRNVSFDMKAAGLAVGALIATPYLFLYDMVALAVPMAFLIHAGRISGFLPYETAALGAACGLIITFPFVKAPVGLAATIVVAVLIARRSLVEMQPAAICAPLAR
jgi:arabinofuranan 3-O-arabinosyltransferase